MLLRDHSHPPPTRRHSWQGFHAMWPGSWPSRGSNSAGSTRSTSAGSRPTGRPGPSPTTWGAALAYAAPPATMTAEVDLGEQYEYEVLLYESGQDDRTLVAAVEFVSPANKDRPDHRSAFVSKCAALLQKGVSMAVIDPVTTRRANLYVELAERIGTADPAFGPLPPLHAASCRTRTVGNRTRLEGCAYPLAVGEPLPPVPLWLTPERAVEPDLNGSYDDTCRVLGVG